METKLNNPNAFPRTPFDDKGDITGWGEDFEGMTLRDYFAAKAMNGIVNVEFGSNFKPISWSEYAYQIADAMLKQREL